MCQKDTKRMYKSKMKQFLNSRGYISPLRDDSTKTMTTVLLWLNEETRATSMSPKRWRSTGIYGAAAIDLWIVRLLYTGNRRRYVGKRCTYFSLVFINFLTETCFYFQNINLNLRFLCLVWLKTVKFVYVCFYFKNVLPIYIS